jgi:hypothetical protein
MLFLQREKINSWHAETKNSHSEKKLLLDLLQADLSSTSIIINIFVRLICSVKKIYLQNKNVFFWQVESV